jgi:hypothetical protein
MQILSILWKELEYNGLGTPGGPGTNGAMTSPPHPVSPFTESSLSQRELEEGGSGVPLKIRKYQPTRVYGKATARNQCQPVGSGTVSLRNEDGSWVRKSWRDAKFSNSCV